MSHRKRPPRDGYGLPPSNRVPSRVADLGPILEIKEYGVHSWCPDDHAKAPAEQVHFMLKLNIGGRDVAFAMRFKTPESVDQLINMLKHHRAYVWPDVDEVPG